MMKSYFTDFAYCPRCGHRYSAGPRLIPLVFICDACGWEFYQNSKPSVAVVIPRREAPDEVLMLRRATEPAVGKLALPGGLLDYGEDPVDGIRRETREETGLNISIACLLCATTIAYDYKGERYAVLETSFVAHPIPDPGLTLRTEEASSVGFEKIAPLLGEVSAFAFPEQASVLRNYANLKF